MDWKKREDFLQLQEYWDEPHRPSLWDRIKILFKKLTRRLHKPFS